MDTIRDFFPESAHFFWFSKRGRGGLAPSRPSFAPSIYQSNQYITNEVCYLHQNDTVDRDIKLSNLFVSHNHYYSLLKTSRYALKASRYLRVLRNFTRKQLCWSLLNKVKGLHICMESPTQVFFLVKLAKSLRIPFCRKHLWWLLL